MKPSNVVSSLLLVGTLTLAAPTVASAHPEGRANCRYATQQTAMTNVAGALAQLRQTASGALGVLAGSIEELDRSVGAALEQLIGRSSTVIAGQRGAAGSGLGSLGNLGNPGRVLTPR